MGTYIYTLRKASRAIVDNSKRTKVNLLSYAYKSSSSWFTESAYNRMVAKFHSLAEKAFNEYNGGYVVVADPQTDEGKATNLDGHEVYHKMTKCDWVDVDKLPMEYVGYLKKVGRSYHLIHAVHEYSSNTHDHRAEVRKRHDGERYIRLMTVDKKTNMETDTYINPEQTEKYIEKNMPHLIEKENVLV